MMFKSQDNKGVILLIVLGTVLIVTILAQAILSITLSHGRLTHHQASKIQAYYAAMAGVNYALEKLRLGNDPDWIAPFVRSICRSGCVAPNINDSAFPFSIIEIKITGTPAGPGCPAPANGVCVSAKATYTLTP